MAVRLLGFILPVLCLTLLTPGFLSQASAQVSSAFDLTWGAVASGGTSSSTGGAFSLSGTVGQPDTGGVSGGSYSLSSGFSPGAGVVVTPPATPAPTATTTLTPPPVTVSVSHAGENRLLVTLTARGTLERIEWVPASNVSVEDSAGTPIVGGALTPPGNSNAATFFVRRLSGTTVTLPLTLTGSFGTWRTFVGGGPDAW